MKRLLALITAATLFGCAQTPPLTQQRLKEMLTPGTYWGEWCRLYPNERQCDRTA